MPARLTALRGHVFGLVRRLAEDLTKLTVGRYELRPAVYISAQRAIEPQQLRSRISFNEQVLVDVDAVADDVDKPHRMLPIIAALYQSGYSAPRSFTRHPRRLMKQPEVVTDPGNRVDLLYRYRVAAVVSVVTM